MRSEKLIRKRLKFFAEMERKVEKSKKLKREHGRFFRDAIIVLWWVLDDEKIALGDLLDGNEKLKSKAIKLTIKS